MLRFSKKFTLKANKPNQNSDTYKKKWTKSVCARTLVLITSGERRNQTGIKRIHTLHPEREFMNMHENGHLQIFTNTRESFKILPQKHQCILLTRPGL